MNLVKQHSTIVDTINAERILTKLEKIGRLCYKSEGRIAPGSYTEFLRQKIDLGHESIIEHESFTVHFITDRGVTHELVRHRLASYTQESTRYCNYSNDEKFSDGITFIDPTLSIELCSKTNTLSQGCKSRLIRHMKEQFSKAEDVYNAMIKTGASAQIARGVLPTDVKAEIYMTANLREWRHFFKMRATKPAHPKMKELVLPLLFHLKQVLPIVFDDIIADPDAVNILYLSEDGREEITEQE